MFRKSIIGSFPTIATCIAIAIGFSFSTSANAQQSPDTIELLTLNGPLDMGVQQTQAIPDDPFRTPNIYPSQPNSGWNPAAETLPQEDPFMVAPGQPPVDLNQSPAPSILEPGSLGSDFQSNPNPNFSPYTIPNTSPEQQPATLAPQLNPPADFRQQPRSFSQTYPDRRIPGAICPFDQPYPTANGYRERIPYPDVHRRPAYIPYGGYVDDRRTDCRNGQCAYDADRYEYEMQRELIRLRESMYRSYRVPYYGGVQPVSGFSFGIRF